MRYDVSDHVPIETLKGKTLKSVETNKDMDEIVFTCTDGSRYLMYHEQDCCEYVYIESVDGEMIRLVGQEILVAEERTSHDGPPDSYTPDDSFTWTFYTLRTNLDSVTIRWFGESNGYYSESVDFAELAD